MIIILPTLKKYHLAIKQKKFRVMREKPTGTIARKNIFI